MDVSNMFLYSTIVLIILAAGYLYFFEKKEMQGNYIVAAYRRIVANWCDIEIEYRERKISEHDGYIEDAKRVLDICATPKSRHQQAKRLERLVEKRHEHVTELTTARDKLAALEKHLRKK